MSRYSKLSKISKHGAVDSKYFSNKDQFEKDIELKIKKTNEFKEEIRQLILKEPDKIEQRYYNAIEVLMDIKRKFLFEQN